MCVVRGAVGGWGWKYATFREKMRLKKAWGSMRQSSIPPPPEKKTMPLSFQMT